MTIEFKFKEDIEPQPCDDFWYDITDGGYIKPENFLSEQSQIDEINKAIELLINFKDNLFENELLEEC